MGGSALNDWVDVNIVNESTTLWVPHTKSQFDFCSTKCMIDYFTKNP